MVFHGFAPTDALDEQVRFTDDQINVVSKAFLGLTISCARCHNHKFDPISQEDFYSWYGIFASCPPGMIDASAPLENGPAIRKSLRKQKQKIKASLIEAWSSGQPVARSLAKPSEDLTKRIGEAKNRSSILHPFHLLDQEKAGDLKSLIADWRSQQKAVLRHRKHVYPHRWANYDDWASEGLGEVEEAGAFAVAAEGDRALTGIYPRGSYSHLQSDKDRGLLLSPRVMLDGEYDLWIRAIGDRNATVRYAVYNYPRNGTVYPVKRVGGRNWQWVRYGLDYWEGDRIHVELTTAADQPLLADTGADRSWVGVREVLLAKKGEAVPNLEGEVFGPLLDALGDTVPGNRQALIDAYGRAAGQCLTDWEKRTLTDSQALFLDALLRADLLPNRLEELEKTKVLVDRFREAEGELPVPVRVPGVLEKDAFDQPLFTLGNHKKPAEPVARRFLDAIDPEPYDKSRSGRLELAEDFFRRDNPLTRRVIVNRVWHHVFGEGLVRTPDNFGRLGNEPTHPELLDHLADWFEKNDYSIKGLIRYLVSSETWKRASDPPPGAVEKDPDNRWLARSHVRRLEAEAIRDSLLAVSGSLKENEMYGRPVTGQAPRRSVYLRVKRNDLDPFLAAFDAPVPASTKGRRDETNVPGQSLTLLNNEFVLNMAGKWAESLGDESSSVERITLMFQAALGRPPGDRELTRSLDFLRWVEEEGRSLRNQRE
ncbi:MAG: DUF1553 domain-containing protein, partial [Verrucomicrobiota bacterium]